VRSQPEPLAVWEDIAGPRLRQLGNIGRGARLGQARVKSVEVWAEARGLTRSLPGADAAGIEVDEIGFGIIADATGAEALGRIA